MMEIFLLCSFMIFVPWFAQNYLSNTSIVLSNISNANSKDTDNSPKDEYNDSIHSSSLKNKRPMLYSILTASECNLLQFFLNEINISFDEFLSMVPEDKTTQQNNIIDKFSDNFRIKCSNMTAPQISYFEILNSLGVTDDNKEILMQRLPLKDTK